MLQQPDYSTQSDTRPANIRHPIAGHRWVMDPSDQNKLVPIGTVGELVVSGPMVGHWYVQNAEATAEAFLTSPSSWLGRFQ